MPKKSTDSKRLSGTFRKDRKKRPPIPRGEVAPPDSLGEEALAIWSDLAPELTRLGILTVADRYQFARYCDAVARWEFLTSKIDLHEMASEQGRNGYRQQVVEISLQQKYGEIIGKLAKKFGLDPVSRLALDILPGNISSGSEADDDPEESIVDRRLRSI